VALVTDAGTPAVSDPGAGLVREVRSAGYRVVPIPGPSALVTALSAAGIESTAFLFRGFLPAKSEGRRDAIEADANVAVPVLFYEAPHRVRETLGDLLAVLGPERRITLARELTKMFESIHECTLGEAIAWIEADPNHARGEFVLILHAAPLGDADAKAREALRVLEVLMRELPASQAAKLAAQITGARRNDLYEAALRLKQAAQSPET
jgi:16S rRNA (cytidine1402-2'-O)-methyltransferase